MTTSTHRPKPKRKFSGGFTLTELLIGMSISSILLLAVISTYMTLARGSMRLAFYQEMDSQTRNGLELFSQEVRMAETITAFSSSTVTMRVRNGPGAATATYTVTYTYDSSTKRFSRTVGTATRILLTNVTDFNFVAYDILQNTTSNLGRIKQLQINLSALRQGVTLADSTNIIVSARYILRNKQVTT